MRGDGCNTCRHKTEHILFEYLKSKYPTTITQFHTNWTRNPETNKYLYYDFYIEDLNVIIEL